MATRLTAAQWTGANPILAAGEYGMESDTRQSKQGDGTTAWNSLGYEKVLADARFGPPVAVGSWVLHAALTLQTFAFANGDCRLGMLWLPDGWTLDGLAWEVTAVGSAGAKSRAVLYKDDGTGKPGALVLDSGQVDSETAAAVKTVTGLSSGVLSSPNGLYWGGVANQGAPTTGATLRYCQTSSTQVPQPTPVLTSLGPYWGLTVTGAPPSTGAAATLQNGGFQRIGVRRAS